MIHQLPDTYREPIRWSEIDGLTQQEVAAGLDSLSGAKSRIQRGRVILKEILDSCCSFEFDQCGNLMNCDPKPDRTVCRDCDREVPSG